MRQAQNFRENNPRLRIAVIIRLEPGHDEVRLLIANRPCEHAGGGEGRQVNHVVANDMNCSISAARQSVFDDTLSPLRSHGNDDDFAANFFLDPQRFFQRVTVRLVDFK